MSEKKGRLGRGLEALIGGDEAAVATAGRADLPLGAIEKSPFQARKTFEEDDLGALSESIRNHGVLQPLVVRQVEGRYQLIAGERRLRAAEAVGLASVPVTVVDFNDQQSFEAALVENIQRSDLNPIEKAHGFKEYLTRYSMTHEQLAGRLGLGRATITNLVALLELPTPLQDAVRRGELSVGHAKALKGLGDPERQLALSKEIVAKGLSVHATEALVKGLPPEAKAAAASGEGKGGGAEKTAHVSGIEDELKQRFGMKVEIRVKGKDRGTLLVHFESNDDFERVLEVMRR